MGIAELEGADLRIGSRDAERSRVTASVELRSAQANCLALIHDLSATGARIETLNVRFEPEDVVQLRLPFLPSDQRGEIAWSDGFSAGVRFNTPIATETVRFLRHALGRSEVGEAPRCAPLAPARSAGRERDHAKRSMERADVAIGATYRTTSGRRGLAVMIDLTPHGCCLFARDVTFATGQQLTLQPECLAGLKATVQWSKGPLTGVLFEAPLYEAVFSHLANTYPWPLSEPMRRALGPYGEVSEPVLRELTRMIARTEKEDHRRREKTDLMSTRPPITSTRPGTAPRTANPYLARVFLG